MTVASEKRLLVAQHSKLTTISSLPTMLSQPAAWSTLPLTTRQHLYSLLPPPEAGEAPWDPDVHPMDTKLRSHISAELNAWQSDLRDGREVKKWRDEAVGAGRKRVEERREIKGVAIVAGESAADGANGAVAKEGSGTEGVER
ncbi:hypothetical protein B0A48_14227 [Cryoendolithus antarcticus]|uniref:ASX DEUBAD domain-containing protein n=1 Tax=Cryoendolithus antarcticus TaxID=1507870 RepID=A0A1V8SLR2_9PEZI|nr:hypothetical protein B0A48_14227 [Cryoendolithus antarcticus]